MRNVGIVLICVLLLAVATAAALQKEAELPAEPADLITDGSWTLVVLPDIQSYDDHSQNFPILQEMMQWIVGNVKTCHIALVLQVGDIVYQNGIPLASMGTGDQNSTGQWSNAQKALFMLNGVAPYILVPGNHDYGITNADGRFTQFKDYFKPTDNPLVDPAQGGILAGLGPNAYGNPTLENAYYDFIAPDGRRMLFLALEWGPRQATVDWANEIAARPEYASYTKALITHAYLYMDDTRYDWEHKGNSQANNPHEYEGTSVDTNDGEELWNKLVKLHRGFQLVFCGHVGGDQVGYLDSENIFGEQAHQLMFNAQFLPKGGQGWLRLLEFLPDGQTVHVRTYSPYFANDGNPRTNPWRMSADDDFSFTLSPQ